MMTVSRMTPGQFSKLYKNVEPNTIQVTLVYCRTVNVCSTKTNSVIICVCRPACEIGVTSLPHILFIHYAFHVLYTVYNLTAVEILDWVTISNKKVLYSPGG